MKQQLVGSWIASKWDLGTRKRKPWLESISLQNNGFNVYISVFWAATPPAVSSLCMYNSSLIVFNLQESSINLSWLCLLFSPTVGFYFRACMLSHFNYVWLFATRWTVAHQAPLSMGFSSQEYWSGLPCPPPKDLPDPGIKPECPVAPTLQLDFLPLSHRGSPSLFSASFKWAIKQRKGEKFHLIQKLSFVSIAVLLVREFLTYTIYLWRNFVHSFFIFMWGLLFLFLFGRKIKYWYNFIFAWYFTHLRDVSIHLIFFF